MELTIILSFVYNFRVYIAQDELRSKHEFDASCISKLRRMYYAQKFVHTFYFTKFNKIGDLPCLTFVRVAIIL